MDEDVKPLTASEEAGWREAAKPAPNGIHLARIVLRRIFATLDAERAELAALRAREARLVSTLGELRATWIDRLDVTGKLARKEITRDEWAAHLQVHERRLEAAEKDADAALAATPTEALDDVRALREAAERIRFLQSLQLADVEDRNEEFRRATGVMAPGKDWPAAAGPCPHADDERRARYQAWNLEQWDAAIAVLDAAVAGTAWAATRETP